MSRRTRSSTSTPATPNSVSTILDGAEQTLTPATCLSETSSTTDAANATEHHLKAEKSTRRVTRASLKLDSTPAIMDNDGTTDKAQVMVTETSSVMSTDQGKPDNPTVRRSLRSRCSLATTELSGYVNGDKDDNGQVVSKVVETQSTETGCQKGKEMETVSSAEEKMETDKKSSVKEEVKSRRRSTRINLLEKSTAIIQGASSVLGKRQRDSKDGAGKAKVPDRRASLRPRNVKETTQPIASDTTTTSKTKSLSKDKADSSKKSAETTPCQTPKREKPVRCQRKLWLSHGLYAGQNTFSSFVMPASKKRKGPNQERTLFPMPKYAGAKLLETGRDFKLPFDIFSPLPRGQPKPDEWRKINKNVFIGDAAGIWKATMPKEQSTCPCSIDTGCDENCQNRYMLYECDSTNCKFGEELCGNRSFAELRRRNHTGRKYDIGVEVIKTENRGYGVRSNRTFEPNQIIVEYTGEVITQEECERRMKTLYKNNECYYLMYFDQNMTIDATRGSIARFVNHSCEPNCRMEKWTVAGKPRIALFAGENGIMTGEELSYDYNFDPFSQKNVQECRCGTPSCRGVLGPRPKQPAKSKEETQPKPRAKPGPKPKPKLAGTKHKRNDRSGGGGVLDDSASRVNKRRKLAKASSAVKSGLKKAVSKISQTVKPRKVKPVKRQVNVKAGLARAKPGPKPKPKANKGQQSNASKASPRSTKKPATQTRLNMPSKPRIKTVVKRKSSANAAPAKKGAAKSRKPKTVGSAEAKVARGTKRGEK